MVAVWFAVTDGAVNSPAALIVPRFVLQVGVTEVVVVSLQVAVAVYVPVPPSFTDDAPLIAMLLSVTTGGVTIGTTHGNAGESADSSPVFITAFAVK
jgi:hypothetical protein